MPPLQSNSITLRVPPRRRVVLALIVVEQPTRIRGLLAREAQRQLDCHTIPVRVGTRNLVAKHFALSAPRPSRDIGRPSDCHARSTRMTSSERDFALADLLRRRAGPMREHQSADIKGGPY